MIFLLILIFCGAAVSLLSALYCWQDIQGGKPHIISLRSITTIMDRNALNRLYGRPDARWRYNFTPEALAAFNRRWRGQFYQDAGADITCLIGAYRYATEAAFMPLFPWFILLAGAYQIIGYVWSYRQVRRWEHQLREEIDGFDD